MKTRQISAWIVAGVVMSTVFTSCKSSDSAATLPAIGGYNSSNDVAPTNLLAHWTFETTQNELISNTAPSKTYGSVSYVNSLTTGAGQALNVTAGAVVYPPIAKINAANALASYTLSMWVNVKNNGKYFTAFFGLFPTAAKGVFDGSISASAETGSFAPSATADTLVLKTNYSSLLADGNFNGQDNRPDPRGKPPVGVFKGAGVWSHFVVRFDPATHLIQIFANGTSIGAYDNRGVNTVALNLPTPVQAMIGSLPGTETGFTQAGPLPSYTTLGTFAIDNIRVYNKPLSDTDIGYLYQLESAGR